MANDNEHHPFGAAGTDDPCAHCDIGRRRFVSVVASALAAIGVGARDARAMRVRIGRALASAGGVATYGIPSTDGATIDVANHVLLVRWQGRLYAFSSLCPHQRAPLQWSAGAHEFICPKHKSHYSPAGEHLSGRSTRNLDRYPIARVGANVAVTTSVTYRDDQQHAQWSAATVLA